MRILRELVYGALTIVVNFVKWCLRGVNNGK